jgi:amidohydrolase
MPNLDAARKAAADAIAAADAGLRTLSLGIHAHPELNFEEHHAHDVLTTFLDALGFTVTRGAYGMPTAFAAVAGSGSPTIAVFCEYDALPGIGHACGHNLIAASGVATALGLKAALPAGSGTILVLGSPAEEGGGGKVKLIEAGALEGVAAAMMLHPTPGDAAWANVIAVEQFKIDYHGRNAHASATPDQGINALDAIVLAYQSISVMRQQLRPTDRVHGIITEGGLKPNIIPDHTAAEYYIRARNARELEDLRAKIIPCFEAAATATGCSVDVRSLGVPYTDLVNNDILAAAYAGNMATLELEMPSKEASLAGPAASTDMGNVSYVVPSIHPMFRIPTTAANHTAGFTGAAATPEAHRAMLRASTALAFTALDAYLRPDVLQRAVSEFQETVAG